MVKVLLAGYAIELNAFFEQKFVDVYHAAAGENFFKAVFFQLVVAGAAAHHHGFDVEVVERVGHAVEEHAVFGGHFFGFGCIAAGILRVAAAKVARRQHGLHAGVPQHGLGGQAYLAEQALGAAAGEVKHRFAVFRQRGVADNRHSFVVFHAQEGAGGFNRHVARQRAVDEMHHLLFDRRGAHGGFGGGFLLFGAQTEFFAHLVAPVLQSEAGIDYAFVQQVDGARIFGIQKSHAGGHGGVEFALAAFAQIIADGHGNVAEIDIHRAGLHAAVAHGAMVAHIVELVEMAQRHAAAGLLFV